MNYEKYIIDHKAHFIRMRKSNGNHVSYGYLSGLKKPQFYSASGACHAGIISNIPGVSTNLVRFYSQLRMGTGDPNVAHIYWDDIFSDESPWKLVLNDLEVYRDNEGYYAYSVAIDDKTPSQVLANFAIAARFPYEHRDLCANYHMFRTKYKLDARRAILLAHLYVPSTSDVVSYDKGHIAITPSTIDIKKFVDADPQYNPDWTMRKRAPYSPCNAIWKDGKRPADMYKPCVELISFINTLTKKPEKETVSKMKFKNKFEDLSLSIPTNNVAFFPKVNADIIIEGLRNYV